MVIWKHSTNIKITIPWKYPLAMISDDDYEYNSPLQCVRTSLVSFQKKWGALAGCPEHSTARSVTIQHMCVHIWNSRCPSELIPNFFISSHVQYFKTKYKCIIQGQISFRETSIKVWLDIISSLFSNYLLNETSQHGSIFTLEINMIYA